mmetsp:Transcript_99387/g.207045  ORF Transcript_99387/g.207045 Transcript_99387/m.207045 type:complete len:476 (+) Transcript_99387:85-1512(+)
MACEPTRSSHQTLSQTMPTAKPEDIDFGPHLEGLSPCSKRRAWRLPGNLQLRSMLGSGSYGTVCEAVDTEKKRVVAIKRIGKVFQDLVAAKRVLREVAILSRLDSPHIVKMFSVVVPDNNVKTFNDLYVVMEVGDTDLKALMQTDIEFTQEHVRWIFLHFLLGLQHLHAAGVIHRDLKPSNVLVNKDCGVKICDFGLARTIGDHEDQIQLTPANSLSNKKKNSWGGEREVTQQPSNVRRALTKHVQTRFYRAPELCLLQDEYSEAIDMWSAGCIFAELTQLLPGFPVEERMPLFVGSTCFPLSPDPHQPSSCIHHSRSRRDQLNVVFDLIGTPSEAEAAQLDREDALQYLRCFTPRRGEGLEHRLPHINGHYLQILKQLLRFGPQDRPDTHTILLNPVLAEIHPRQDGMNIVPRIDLAFDRAQHRFSEDELRDLFAREMAVANQGSAGIELASDTEAGENNSESSSPSSVAARSP